MLNTFLRGKTTNKKKGNFAKFVMVVIFKAGLTERWKYKAKIIY